MNALAHSTNFTMDGGRFQSLVANPEVGSLTSLPTHTEQKTSFDWDELMGHREYLVRFAKRKLHDPCLAEDVVHDVFEAVLRGRSSFAGRSALRSWLTAILKNKIVDLIRQRSHYDCLEDENETSDIGHMQCPQPGPLEMIEQRQLLRQTLQRIDALAPGLRDVMTFRVIEEESSEDVCTRLQISESSLFVRLHRARKHLLC